MADVCASFQEAVVDVLVDKTLRAARDLGVRNITLAGGVAANQRLRERLGTMCRNRGFDLFVPSFQYCTDNAAMIAKAGYVLAGLGVRSTWGLDAHANLLFTDWGPPS